MRASNCTCILGVVPTNFIFGSLSQVIRASSRRLLRFLEGTPASRFSALVSLGRAAVALAFVCLAIDAHAQSPVLIKEVISREVSIHVGGIQTPEIKEVISREASVFILNGPAEPYSQVISREVSVVVATPDRPPKVTGFTVTPSPIGDRVVLDWKNYNQWAIKDVARFDIYLTNRAFSDVTGMTPVRSVPAETVTTTLTGLPTLQDHFTAIVAVDALGNYDPIVTYSAAYILSPEVISREVSLFVGEEPQPPFRQAISREVSIAVATPELPTPVTDVAMTVSPTGETVTLNWNNYNQWSERDIGRYDIYFSNRSFTNVSGMTRYAVVPGEQLAITFNDLPTWRDHFFAVVPVDAAGKFNPAVTYSAAYVLSPQVISREVSLFVGDEPLSPYREAVSREVSLLVPEAGVPAPVTGINSGFLAASSTTLDGAIDLDWTRYNELLQRDVMRYRLYVTTSLFDNVSALAPFSYLTDGTQHHLLTGLSDGRIYYVAVVAEDALGQFDPAVRSVSVQASNLPADGPVIVQPPQSQTIEAGGSVTLTVLASGLGGLNYQWRKNGVNIDGATGATFTIPRVQPSDGGSYTVAVSSNAGSIESIAALLSIVLPLVELTDNFADRRVFTEPSFTGITNNLAATAEAGEPRHAGKRGGKSLWMTWKAPASGVITFSTAGSSFDTLLAVYAGGAVNALTEVASDEDRGGFLTSRLAFNAVAGTDYQIAVDGFAAASGVVVLSWDLVADAPALPVITQQPESRLAVVGDAVQFTVAAQPVGVTYQWLLNGQDLAGETRSDLSFTADGSRVGTYRARVRAPNGQTIESADAILELLDQPQAGPRLSADKLDDLFGSGEVALAGLPRVGLNAALPPSQGWVQETDLSQSTRSADDPEPCGVITSATRWFRVRPLVAATGRTEVLLSTIGSDVPTLLGVFTNRSTLRLVVCSGTDRGLGQDATVIFPAVRNVDYLVMVARIGAGPGKVRLSYRGAEELSNFVRAFGMEAGYLQVQMLVAPGKYEWSWGSDPTVWTPLFQTNVQSGLFQYSEPLQLTAPARLFRLLPAK